MKNLTVVLKSLILTATIGSLAACSSSPYQTGSIQQPVVVSQYAGYSLIVDASKQLWLNNRYGLNKDQKLKQTQAIYAALGLSKLVSYENNAIDDALVQKGAAGDDNMSLKPIFF